MRLSHDEVLALLANKSVSKLAIQTVYMEGMSAEDVNRVVKELDPKFMPLADLDPKRKGPENAFLHLLLLTADLRLNHGASDDKMAKLITAILEQYFKIELLLEFAEGAASSYAYSKGLEIHSLEPDYIWRQTLKTLMESKNDPEEEDEEESLKLPLDQKQLKLWVRNLSIVYIGEMIEKSTGTVTEGKDEEPVTDEEILEVAVGMAEKKVVPEGEA